MFDIAARVSTLTLPSHHSAPILEKLDKQIQTSSADNKRLNLIFLNRGVTSAAPSVWNSLQVEIRLDNKTSFKTKIKTVLFKSAYFYDWSGCFKDTLAAKCSSQIVKDLENIWGNLMSNV